MGGATSATPTSAGHFLNPGIFYDNPRVEFDEKVNKGLLVCIQKLIPEHQMQDKIISELSKYKMAQGLFCNPLAVRSRKTRSPAEWWSLYGSSAPNLQQLAIKILSLTCSLSSSERKRSAFGHVHAKKEE